MIVDLFAIFAGEVCGERWTGKDPRVDGASAAVAVVGEVVGAFVGGGGSETHLFVAAGGLKFVVAAHVEDLRVQAFDLGGVLIVEFDWGDGGAFCLFSRRIFVFFSMRANADEKEKFMDKQACFTYLPLLI